MGATEGAKSAGHCVHECDEKAVVTTRRNKQEVSNRPQPTVTQPSKHFRTTNVSADNAGGGYCPSYAWGCSRLHRVAKEAAEKQAVQDTIQELKTANSALSQELAHVRTTSHATITALKDHLSHTEAQLAAEKERSLSFYQGLKTAKQTLKEDRETRQVAVTRATAALTRLDREEDHWRKIDGVNKSLERELSEAQAQLERLRRVEKERALLEERLTEERQGRERAEGAAQGLREEKTRLVGELERLTGVEAVLREVEETRDALQEALTEARGSLNRERKACHVANGQVSTLEGENAELRGDQTRMEAFLNEEQARIKELEQLLERVLQKKAEREQENRVLKKDLEVALTGRAQAEARVEQQTVLADGEREAKLRAERNGTECAERLGEARKEAASLAELLTSAEEELRALDNECEEISAQRARWEAKAGEAWEELSTTKCKLEDVAAKLRFESNARGCAEKDNERLRSESAKVEEALKSTRGALETTDTRLKESKEELLAARAEMEGVKRAVEWAEKRADEAKRAADVAADRATAEHRTVEKLMAEIEGWRAKNEALEADLAGHVAAREQQLEAAVRREVAARDEYEERERRLIMKLDGKEREWLEAREKSQEHNSERATSRADLDRALEKVRVLEAQARDAQDTLRRAMRAREEAEGAASKAAADAAAARAKAATLRKENAAMMANYDAWLRTLVKSSRLTRPLTKVASALHEAAYESVPFFRSVRTNHERGDAAQYMSSPERDPPRKDYFAAHRKYESSRERTAQRNTYAADDSSNSGD
ncbi:hypothetical protein KFL_006300070 [Klebsormidium nitens]|uniref:Uncharacterized protein n=1 Tax=Klebsormidium nitens TaxID=105231 RepID=A0A1Y1ILM4_KLENI|nr:hypothetical protein KFL_006300070 [Klebsormidium nitens]|eukprot:GAQ90349.1 hypothetical protein KFL_006300070 [Klebsormidium nitens]